MEGHTSGESQRYEHRATSGRGSGVAPADRRIGGRRGRVQAGGGSAQKDVFLLQAGIGWQEGLVGNATDDILFLQSIANTLATAIERQRAEAERERLLAQIQEQVQQVQQIIDTVPEGVVLLDANEHVILVSPVAEKDLLALTDIGVGDTLTRLGNHPLVELLTSPPKGLWYEITTDGRSFQVIARPIETGPTPGGWVLVIRDVTKERDVQQRVQQQERLVAVEQLAEIVAKTLCECE
jgi:PAS domain-containing protein